MHPSSVNTNTAKCHSKDQMFVVTCVIMIGDWRLELERFAGCSLWFIGGGKCFFILLTKVDFIRMDYNLGSKYIFKDKTIHLY